MIPPRRRFWLLRTVITLLVILLDSPLVAQGSRFSLYERLSWRLGDQAPWGNGAREDGWEPVGDGTLDFGHEGAWFWLRTELSPQDLSGEGPCYLLARKVNLAMEIFLDGILIGTQGSMPPSFESHGKDGKAFLLPLSEAQRRNGAELAIRCHSDGASYYLSPLFLGDAKAAAFETKVVSFFNMTLYYVLGWICLSAGLFFFMQFVANPQDRPNAFYALASIAIALYFMEMGSDGSLLPFGLNRSLAKACLTISVSSLILFFRSYFGLRTRKTIVAICVIEPALVTAAFIWAVPAQTRCDMVFTLALVPILLSIIYMLFLVIRELRAGNREAIPILVGVIAGVGAGLYDSFYKFQGREPFVWLQGFGFFFLDISMFAALSIRSNRLHRELGSVNADMVAKSAQMAEFVERVSQAARKVAHISKGIDSSVGPVRDAASRLKQNSRSIGDTSSRQSATIDATAKTLGGLLSSQDLIYRGIETQSDGISRATRAVEDISRSIVEITDSTRVTRDLAIGLDESTVQGLSAARELKSAMDKIARASSEIGPIVDAVDEFAERTDLLAMNAAIEAAHSGAAGRGFAVIAGEIKKLAAASSERAAQIRTSVEEIVARIAEGVQGEAQVSSSLQAIASRASDAGSRVERIYASISAQKESAGSLVRIMEELAASASAIRREADTQASGSREIRKAMDDLVGCTETMRAIIDSLVRESGALGESVASLAVASTEGGAVLSDLESLLTEES